MKTKIKYLLVLVLASFVFVGCCTTHSRTAQWEYKTINVYPTGGLAEKELNKLGKDGWQLTAAAVVDATSGSGSMVIYYFKRPIH